MRTNELAKNFGFNTPIYHIMGDGSDLDTSSDLIDKKITLMRQSKTV